MRRPFLMLTLLLGCSDYGRTDDTGGGTTGPVTTGTRGVWAWQDSGDSYGTLAVVGDTAAEEAMVLDLVDWGVDRVYGSYGNRPVTEPAVIAAWNQRLHDAGIESHVLMGDPAWISSREWAGMEEKIQQRLLEFNAALTDPTEHFDGLHLDIEPQAGAYWDTATESDKLAYLGLLEETYEFADGVMTAGSGATLPIAADLPVWFDNLPPALGGAGQVGWESAAQRDAWFVDIGDHLASISMMAYEDDSETSIASKVSVELSLFPGELRVGLNEEVGTTWSVIGDMFAMADTLETAGYPVDLHSFSAIRGELPP